MKKIGITGSLASGKTTASKILSAKKGPLFSADNVVKNLYKKDKFKKIVSKKLKIKNYSNIKKKIKERILVNKKSFKELEKIIHPLVRKEMFKFMRKNKKKEFSFYEIPLLTESKLMKYFDIILFIKAKKNIRLRRFILKGGDAKLFKVLNNKQYSDTKKARYCNHVVLNEKNIKILKKKLSVIFNQYE